MSNIKYSTTELIGGTPLLSLKNYQAQKGVTGAEIIAKLELFNPAGSAKDRAKVCSQGSGTSGSVAHQDKGR